MATGNAVVATSNAAGGIVCRHGENIEIVDESVAFAQTVIQLLNDKQRRDALGISAVQNIRRHYSWDRNLHALDRLIEGERVRGEDEL